MTPQPNADRDFLRAAIEALNPQQLATLRHMAQTMDPYLAAALEQPPEPVDDETAAELDAARADSGELVSLDKLRQDLGL